ncbi:MAG TPA: phosphoenolpyruvate synthase [Polyangiaceae bacterium]|nr:phosphoenolpyruvate synthase [Polyangiaceae bacterium]
MTPRYVVPFEQLTLADIPRVGGKNAALGELTNRVPAGVVDVPGGFAITVEAFRLHLRENDLESAVYGPLDRLDLRSIETAADETRRIRDRIRHAPLPKAVETEVLAAYAALSARYGGTDADVAVRSSATAEDLPEASFAGQHESYLHVRGPAQLLRVVRECMASLFTHRAVVYRTERGYGHRSVGLSVGVQKMVRSDLGSAGVIFTLDTETGFPDVVVVTAGYGLGESVVKGRIDPDEYWVFKPTLATGARPIVKRELGDKATRLVYSEGSDDVREERVPLAERRRFALDDDEILHLSRVAVEIEKHYTKRAGKPVPMDIEWAKDGESGRLFIVQARPETVHADAKPGALVLHRLRGKGKVLLRGKSVGASIGRGKVRVVRALSELSDFQDGEVLVASSTDPDWEPVLKRAAAVVTDHGGRTCHAAIVSREHGIPCVVGTGQGTQALVTGQTVTVSCAEGTEGRVYDGLLEFDREEVDPATLPVPRVPIMLNVGNPENVFQTARLPSAGVGLVRIEFVISSWIGIHPMALLHREHVSDPVALAEIAARTEAYPSPSEFFVDRLATGVAQIAAAFFPRPIIVRFSDFKTNEYATLRGGAPFEPKEENPMIGFRGASRYYDDRYREAFALECAAIRRVREQMGLRNVFVMIPFCRTLEEGRRVLAEMKRSGLERGKDDLQVYVMCEIPNNVVLAAEFSELFDGFSIGSNDLTQLTLGVDRDSELLAHVFDENDPGVRRLIEQVIRVAHEKGRKVGLCGQAPSDRPEFATFLADLGIDSISVTPDALARVIAAVGPKRSAP